MLGDTTQECGLVVKVNFVRSELNKADALTWEPTRGLLRREWTHQLKGWMR